MASNPIQWEFKSPHGYQKICPSSPMAEASGLKSEKCGFKSCLGYQICSFLLKGKDD